MFCATVSDGSRLKAWNTNPIRSRRRMVRRRSLSRARSASPSVTVPDVGRSSPAATLSNVLLPEPEGPMMAVNDPRGSATLTPSRATTAPSPLPWTLRTSRSATAGAMAAISGGGRVELNMVPTLAIAPRRSHPGCLPLASARGCRGGRPAVPCAAPRPRLESGSPDDPLDALGRRSERAGGPSARARPRPRAGPVDGSDPQPVVLARAVDLDRRRRLHRPDPRAHGPRPAGAAVRGAPQPLRRVLRG